MLNTPSTKKAILMKPFPNEDGNIGYKLHAVIECESIQDNIRYNNAFYEFAGVMDGYAIYNYVSSIEES